MWTTVATLYLTILSAPIALEENSLLKLMVDDIIARTSLFPSSWFQYASSTATDTNLRGYNDSTVNGTASSSIGNGTLDHKSQIDIFTFLHLLYSLFTTKSSTNHTDGASSISGSITPLSPIDMMKNAEKINDKLSQLSYSDMGILLIFVVSSGVCIGVGSLLSFHMYLGILISYQIVTIHIVNLTDCISIASSGFTTLELYGSIIITEKIK